MKGRLKYFQACINASVEAAKGIYYLKTVSQIIFIKLLKAYWSLLKVVLNDKKIPITPPRIYKNRFVTVSKKKSNFSTLSF